MRAAAARRLKSAAAADARPPHAALTKRRCEISAPLVLALLLVVIACVGACATAARNMRAAAMPALDAAVLRTARGAASREPQAAPQFRSGDILLMSFNNDIPAWPEPLRGAMRRLIVHAGVALEHPQHGMCFVDSFGSATARPPRLHQRVPDVFQGVSIENSSVRVLPLGPLLRELRGCVWVRHLDARAHADAAAMWAAVAAANAPRGGPRGGVRNGVRDKSFQLSRVPAWLSRVLLRSTTPLLDWAPRHDTARVTCLQWTAAILSAGGVWATAPHALDAELQRVAPPSAALLAANWAAVTGLATPPPPPPVAAVHALTMDYSSSSAVPYSRLWGPEVFVPCAECKLWGKAPPRRAAAD